MYPSDYASPLAFSITPLVSPLAFPITPLVFHRLPSILSIQAEKAISYQLQAEMRFA
jgi:hypothetical protein